MCETHRSVGSQVEVRVPVTRTATLESKSESGHPAIEAPSRRALPDRTDETRAKVADSLGGSDGSEPRSDRGSGSSDRKNDPRGNDQKPSNSQPLVRPYKVPKPPSSAPVVAQKPAPKKPATPAAPITAESAPVKPQPAKPTPVAVSKPEPTKTVEITDQLERQIVGLLQRAMDQVREYKHWQNQNKRTARDRAFRDICEYLGKTPGSNVYAAIKPSIYKLKETSIQQVFEQLGRL